MPSVCPRQAGIGKKDLLTGAFFFAQMPQRQCAQNTQIHQIRDNQRDPCAQEQEAHKNAHPDQNPDRVFALDPDSLQRGVGRRDTINNPTTDR